MKYLVLQRCEFQLFSDLQDAIQEAVDYSGLESDDFVVLEVVRKSEIKTESRYSLTNTSEI